MRLILCALCVWRWCPRLPTPHKKTVTNHHDRWHDDLLITRAPGRLDVMGGIADYSGSLVLQMPIGEACHVALQRHPLDKQKVWKHVQVGGLCAAQEPNARSPHTTPSNAFCNVNTFPSQFWRYAPLLIIIHCISRQGRLDNVNIFTLHAALHIMQARHDKLGGARPTLLVVSLHADDTNRAPTFDIDLDDLFNPDGEGHKQAVGYSVCCPRGTSVLVLPHS